MLIIYSLLFLNLIYILLLILYALGLFRLRKGKSLNNQGVSVIISARNEEANIEECLNSILNQNYPKDKYEVIVVNDDSIDNTANKILQFVKTNKNLRLINVKTLPKNINPKVNALELGINSSKHNLILLTDADCIASPNWIKSIVTNFEDEIGLVCGLSHVINKQGSYSIGVNVQAIETLLYFSVCAGSIGIGSVLGATGQNLAFRKSSFHKIGGFEEIKKVVSGFDAALVNKWKRKSSMQIKFAIGKESVVQTFATNKLKDYLNQRARWASSIYHLGRKQQLFAVFIFLLNITTILGIAFTVFKLISPIYIISLILIRIFFEYLMYLIATNKWGTFNLIPYIPIWLLIQVPFYILLLPLGLKRKIKWKGREYSKPTIT